MVGSSPPSSISWSPDTTANWPFAANSSVDFGTPSADSTKGTIFFAILYCHLATLITSSKAPKRICLTFLRFALTVYQPRLILSPLKIFWSGFLLFLFMLIVIFLTFTLLIELAMGNHQARITFSGMPRLPFKLVIDWANLVSSFSAESKAN